MKEKQLEAKRTRSCHFTTGCVNQKSILVSKEVSTVCEFSRVKVDESEHLNRNIKSYVKIGHVMGSKSFSSTSKKLLIALI